MIRSSNTRTKYHGICNQSDHSDPGNFPANCHMDLIRKNYSLTFFFFFLECSIFINYKVLKISSLICQWTMKENTCENLLTANVTYTTMYGFCFIDTITFLNKYLAPPHQILLISWNFRGGVVVAIIPRILKFYANIFYTLDPKVIEGTVILIYCMK